jgi:hypothetical protein
MGGTSHACLRWPGPNPNATSTAPGWAASTSTAVTPTCSKWASSLGTSTPDPRSYNALSSTTRAVNPPRVLGLHPHHRRRGREQHIARSSLKSRLTGSGSAERVMHPDPGWGRLATLAGFAGR